MSRTTSSHHGSEKRPFRREGPSQLIRMLRDGGDGARQRAMRCSARRARRPDTARADCPRHAQRRERVGGCRRPWDRRGVAAGKTLTSVSVAIEQTRPSSQVSGPNEPTSTAMAITMTMIAADVTMRSAGTRERRVDGWAPLARGARCAARASRRASRSATGSQRAGTSGWSALTGDGASGVSVDGCCPRMSTTFPVGLDGRRWGLAEPQDKFVDVVEHDAPPVVVLTPQ